MASSGDSTLQAKFDNVFTKEQEDWISNILEKQQKAFEEQNKKALEKQQKALEEQNKQALEMQQKAFEEKEKALGEQNKKIEELQAKIAKLEIENKKSTHIRMNSK